MEVVADRLTTVLVDRKFTDSERLVMLEAISDLRAAYCSFCNKSLSQDTYIVAGSDDYNNRLLKCSICCKRLVGK